MPRRLNSYEQRKLERAAKRRERYLADRDKRMFEKMLERKAMEQRLEDALEHERRMKDD